MFECDETLFKNACNKILETLLSLKGLKTTIIELQSFSENYEGKEIVNNVTNDLLKINNQISTLFENMQHTLSIILGNNGIMNQELNLDDLDTALSFLDGTIAGEYGVNQSNPYDLFKKYIEDPNSLSKIEKQKIDLIYKLFKDYGYADFSDNMINLSLKAFSNGGCGNAAISNIIIDQYLKMENGVEEFENKYGFPLYYVDENGNKRYNYEGLFVSLYLNRAEEQVNTTPFKYMLGMNKVDNRDYIPILDDFNSFISNIDKAFGLTNKGMTNLLESELDANSIESSVKSCKISIPFTNINWDGTKKIYEESKNDYDYCILHATNFKFKALDKNFIEEHDGNEYYSYPAGHFVLITGVSDNGNPIVTSWGYPFEVINSNTSDLIFVNVGDKNE